MDPRSQVVLRQRDFFSGSVLVAGAPADNLLAELENATAWSWQADKHLFLEQQFPQHSQLSWQCPNVIQSAALLFLPKSRELTAYLLYQLASQLVGKSLFLVGEKRAGIERAAKQLAEFGSVRKLDSARHCQLWQCQISAAPKAIEQQHWLKTFQLDNQGQKLIINSLPGVFSHGHLDLGSALLLEHLDNLPQGHWLDFGCGCGVIGASLKQRFDNAQLSLLDVDAFAIASSKATLAANQLNAEFILGRGIQDAPTQLAAIISNPPFHQGIRTNYQATEQLIAQAPQHLRHGGELRIVANNFLQYQQLIQASFGNCTVLAERDGFRVYSARRV